MKVIENNTSQTRWATLFSDNKAAPTNISPIVDYPFFLANAFTTMRKAIDPDEYRKLLNVLATEIVRNGAVDSFEIPNAVVSKLPGGDRAIMQGIKALIVLAETTDVTCFEDLVNGSASWPIDQDDWDRFECALHIYNAARKSLNLRPLSDSDIFDGADLS